MNTQKIYKKLKFGPDVLNNHILLDGGVEPPTKFSKRRGGLIGSHLLKGDCWERGDDFSWG